MFLIVRTISLGPQVLLKLIIKFTFIIVIILVNFCCFCFLLGQASFVGSKENVLIPQTFTGSFGLKGQNR